ncbi:MAG TPA: type II toxin-antitoxin system RelE/ParE family toxin [Nitrolancea sp.]|nr:type II toxin-antitoxin system RelE/ParE family toxin [Nitrolancea sp.]
MSWQLVLPESIRTQLRELPREDRQAIGRAIDQLVRDPGQADIRKLRGRPDWRLRVGRWRVIFEMNTRASEIHVLAVDDRKDVYR